MDKEENSSIMNKEENSSIMDIKIKSPIFDKKDNSPIEYEEEEIVENLDAFKKAIAFQSNTERTDDKSKQKSEESKKKSEESEKPEKSEESNCYIANPPKKQTNNFDENKEEENSLNVLIQINNISENDKNEYIISNAYLKDISFYSEEEEVLIFPFTGFEVTGWKKYSFSKENVKYNGTIFYFNFSKKYKEIIKEKYD